MLLSHSCNCGLPTDCDSVGHLASGLDDALENLSANGDVAGEGALLVDVLTLNGGLGGLEAKTNVLDVPSALAALAAELAALDRSHVRLLLVSLLVLSAAVNIDRTHGTENSTFNTGKQRG